MGTSPACQSSSGGGGKRKRSIGVMGNWSDARKERTAAVCEASAAADTAATVTFERF